VRRGRRGDEILSDNLHSAIINLKFKGSEENDEDSGNLETVIFNMELQGK